MRYRNTITGYEFETKSICSAPHYELVGAETPKEIHKVEPPKEEAKEPPKPVTKSAQKPAAKKSTKKTVKRSKK